MALGAAWAAGNAAGCFNPPAEAMGAAADCQISKSCIDPPPQAPGLFFPQQKTVCTPQSTQVWESMYDTHESNVWFLLGPCGVHARRVRRGGMERSVPHRSVATTSQLQGLGRLSPQGDARSKDQTLPSAAKKGHRSIRIRERDPRPPVATGTRRRERLGLAFFSGF